MNLSRQAFAPGGKRRRARRIGTAVLAAAAIVSAVGGSVGAARPQSGEPVTVRWFVGLGTGTEPEQIDAQEQLVEEFNASQDAIELQIEIVDNEVAYETLATQIAAGDAPDIIGPIGIRGSNYFAGNFLDLEPLDRVDRLRPVGVRRGPGGVLAGGRRCADGPAVRRVPRR